MRPLAWCSAALSWQLGCTHRLAEPAETQSSSSCGEGSCLEMQSLESIPAPKHPPRGVVQHAPRTQRHVSQQAKKSGCGAHSLGCREVTGSKALGRAHVSGLQSTAPGESLREGRCCLF